MNHRFLLCAASSGSGKTTVTCGIMMALKKRGIRLSGFKCGPDYIDPMFHREVLGLPSRNLDSFFLDTPILEGLMGEYGRDLAVIEGVMGYYDGIALTSQASAYALARATATPAVLVVDGRGSALTLAAVVKGLVEFRSQSQIQGVILNRVSPMLYPRLKEAIEEETGVRVYGFLPPCPECAVESRHLGLVLASEVANLQSKLEQLALQVEKTVDLDGLLELGQSAPALNHQTLPQVERVAEKARIAVAKDAAFCFYYPDSLDLLERLGAELVPFSPLEDQELPADVGGLYLGGGYPELYAGALSENTSMRESIKKAVEGGLPTLAECGGFLYLHESLEDEQGVPHPMVGVIHQPAVKTGKLQRFGYITMTAQQGGLLGEAGTKLPAHEFHYWESGNPGDAFYGQKPSSNRGWPCAYHTPTLYAGFPHFHLWGNVNAARHFVQAAAQYGQAN